MDPSPSGFAGAGGQPNGSSALDPRLQPTPDYGTLGPGSDIGSLSSGPDRPSPTKAAPRLVQLLAAAFGMFFAIVGGTIARVHPDWPGATSLFSGRDSQRATSKDLRQIERMKPQQQAETLLELAVGHSAGAVEQISSHVDRWHGRLHWTSQIASLSTAALNSDDLRVRESGVEVELAAYGLSKNSASLDYLLKTADSPDHGQKIWAFWALGLMANRGVQTEQVVDVLTAHLKDSDVDSRRWAVEALALAGSDQSIEPLLTSMHDDSSPLVRERAACGLASSGLFTPQQRLTAVPRLLDYSDDPSLDVQTRAWVFHALADITHQRLPNDSAQWRSWYDSQRSE